jgi:kynurenine formamidase
MSAPAGSEVLGYLHGLSNWGRWGGEDQLGTLNLVTSASLRKATELVSEGISVSCAHDIDPSTLDAIHQFHRYMVVSGEGLGDEHRVPHMAGGSADQRWVPFREYLGMVFHGPLVTHLDAPSHMSWDKEIYNGYPAERVNSVSGALDLSVLAMAHGVTTRGVLIDIASSRGNSSFEPVGREELLEVESRQKSVVQEGDVVLLRTGGSYHDALAVPGSNWDWKAPKAGWAADCLPWFHERGVAMIGHDGSNDASPSGYESFGIPTPIHVVSLVALGLWLLDNVALEELADTCKRLNRWEFMMTIAPLRISGGTGSPVNPIATF